jgi:hypothetical protein
MRQTGACFHFGLCFAFFQHVISPSSLTGFGWFSAAVPSSGMSGAGGSASKADASNSPAADSFQDIFAQVSAPDAAPAPSRSSANSVPQAPAQGATSASPKAASETDDASPVASVVAGGDEPKDERTDKTVITQPPSSEDNGATSGVRTVARNLAAAALATLRPNSSTSAVRTLPQRAAAGKQAAVSQAAAVALHPIALATAQPDNSGAQPVVETGPALGPTPVPVASASPSQPGSPSSGLEQNALPAAAVAALGGVKSLSGAAFALHINKAASQSNLNQSNASQSNASAEAEQAIPAANGLGDPSPAASGLLSAVSGHAPTPAPIANGAGLAAAPALVVWAAVAPEATPNNQAGSTQAEPPATAASESGADEPAGDPQPLRTLQMQLAGEGEGRVDVRLVEHGGGLSVSVRATDSELTKGLQDNLPELSARLAADKYQTHAFLPAAGETSSGGSAPGSSERSFGQAREQSGGRSFSQGGSASGGNSGGRPQDQPPAWWRQMAALGKLAAATSVAGSQPDAAANPPVNS